MADVPSSPAALRNREPIAAVLETILPADGLVLEVGSGTGEHAEYFAGRFPALTFQPSDADQESLRWIAARVESAALPNLLEPVPLNAAEDRWPVDRADAILCSNVVHISPWQTTLGLLRGAGRLLTRGAPLIVYGPYRRADV